MAPESKFVQDLLKDKSLLPKIKDHLLALPKETLVDMLISMAPDDGPQIPLSIFHSSLSPLQATVLYLREHLNYKNKDIASLLNRSSQVIWSTYNNARKQDVSLTIDHSQKIPFRPCIRDNLTILEGIVCYLRDERNLRYSEIASLLNRNERTIWTVYRRARQK